jgi:hypothetical protein
VGVGAAVGTGLTVGRTDGEGEGSGDGTGDVVGMAVGGAMQFELERPHPLGYCPGTYPPLPLLSQTEVHQNILFSNILFSASVYDMMSQASPHPLLPGDAASHKNDGIGPVRLFSYRFL